MLQALKERMELAKLTVFLKTAVVQYIQARVAKRFQSEGDDVTGRWTPLAVETELIRAAQGFPPSHPINVRTGEMMQFLVADSGDAIGSGGFAVLTYPSQPPTGELERKMRTAQLGKPFPSTPPRPVLGLNMNDNIFITAELAGYLMSPI